MRCSAPRSTSSASAEASYFNPHHSTFALPFPLTLTLTTHLSPSSSLCQGELPCSCLRSLSSVALLHGGPPARLLLLHDALRAFGASLFTADGTPLEGAGAQQARRVAAAVRALLPLTRPELKATEASALSSYLAAVTAAPAATGGQATGGQAGQPRRLACLLGWSGTQAGGSEQVVHLLQAALHSLKDEERRTLDWHFCSNSSNSRGTNSAPGTAAQPNAAVGQLALCGASELVQGCLDGAQHAGVTPHAAVASGLAALCDILRKARAALDSTGEQRDDTASGGGAGSMGSLGGGGGGGNGGGAATPVVNLSCVARVAAVACLRSAATRESVGFSVLRCAPHGAYIGVETGTAAASGAAQRLLHSEPRQERGLRTRLQHAVYPAAADAIAADASDSVTADGKGLQPAVPLIIMTDPGKDQDDELALILCRTMCDLDRLELKPNLYLLYHHTIMPTIPLLNPPYPPGAISASSSSKRWSPTSAPQAHAPSSREARSTPWRRRMCRWRWAARPIRAASRTTSRPV